MKMIVVESSNVKKVGYDRFTKTLAVEYAAGRYLYSDVEIETFVDLINAESIGSFMNAKIKNNYNYTKAL